ncbi:hypothetical protein AQJ67_12275 [Streptomyces caeruleatus]|uniref:Uncharacterized protein n=1 Tax=Streptomyces caeruleatus TaxID=661399 RepID=A0A101U5J5_9ACTN|nr:aconitase family protein [Streptomyces caeruleatus]KUO04503.1 hypothetical protein AQJ67_12275 [Streptomyces caeruleatus]
MLTLTELLRAHGVIGKDRVPLDQAKSRFRSAVDAVRRQSESDDTRTSGTSNTSNTSNTSTVVIDGTAHELSDGAVAVAAITSCTTTSNPAVMVGAGLLARNAVRAGLRSKPWVKTTLSPGSRAVMDYFRRAGLVQDLEALGFHLAGFGCMTCIKLGDHVTTDHISPAGAITAAGAAADYLAQLGVPRGDFNTYASLRGNHQVMMRGAFANVRLRNQVAPGTRGGRTRNFLADGREDSIHDTAAAYRAAGVPMVVVAGRDYGGGSSRDWAAKRPALLGVRSLIAQSFERIHRSNLIAMGVLPLELVDSGPRDLAPTGTETITVSGLETLNTGHVPATVRVLADGREFTARVRLPPPARPTTSATAGSCRTSFAACSQVRRAPTSEVHP